MQQRRHPLLHREIDASQYTAFDTSARGQPRLRRRFFVALFVALLGLTGFMVVLIIAITR